MKVFLFGHNGLVGESIHRELLDMEGFEIVTRARGELDLRDREAVRLALKSEHPDGVILAAAKVGGIEANNNNPVQFLSDNLQIQTNVIDASHEAGVARLVFLGSSCIYPKQSRIPIKETELLSGPLENTNEAYALAKIAGLKLVESYEKQYNHAWKSVMPTNVYGLRDDFSSDNSHVIPALIRRINEAVKCGNDQVLIWGSGKPLREFIHSDDLAKAVVEVLLNENINGFVNIGTGEEISIKNLAKLIAELSGFKGELVFDTSKPDGTYQKTLDSTILRSTGWRPRRTLREGLEELISAYKLGKAGRH